MPRHVVDNHGSEARDHLANERTFLAWFRTSLGLVGLGVVVERLEVHGPVSARLGGLLLIAFGGLSMLYGIDRYLRVSRHLEEGKFPVAKHGPLWLGLGVLVIAGGAAVYLWR